MFHIFRIFNRSNNIINTGNIYYQIGSSKLFWVIQFVVISNCFRSIISFQITHSISAHNHKAMLSCGKQIVRNLKLKKFWISSISEIPCFVIVFYILPGSIRCSLIHHQRHHIISSKSASIHKQPKIGSTIGSLLRTGYYR